GADAHRPAPGLGECVLEGTTNPEFGNVSAPTAAAGPALVAESADVIPFFTIQVTETWHIDAVGTATIIIFIFIPFNASAGTAPEMVVHDVVSQFTGATAQPIGPYIRCGIHQYPRRIHGGCIQEDDFCLIYVCFIGFRIQHFHACCAFRVAVIKHLGDD